MGHGAFHRLVLDILIESGASENADTADSRDAILFRLADLELAFVDKRPQGGRLWVGDAEHAEERLQLISDEFGLTFQFAASSRILKGSSGWWLDD